MIFFLVGYYSNSSSNIWQGLSFNECGGRCNLLGQHSKVSPTLWAAVFPSRRTEVVQTLRLFYFSGQQMQLNLNCF